MVCTSISVSNPWTITGITATDNGNLTISISVTTNNGTASSYQFSVLVDSTTVWSGASQNGIVLNSVPVTAGSHNVCAQ